MYLSLIETAIGQWDIMPFYTEFAIYILLPWGWCTNSLMHYTYINYVAAAAGMGSNARQTAQLPVAVYVRTYM